ncbi:hypothetical protein ES332_D03G053000v1 [Gossypium tomentosum]|uniref:Uncharacterized protein n=1 Tax=Gossypium tomentosum TaxID=34277 RepID=A0A5D2LIK7_GOSTO|nr:hypothetical protein ES332_D03G053000v1 [Gossypium tomentosum]
MMTERRPGSLHQTYGEVDVEARVDLAGTEGHVRAEARAGGGRRRGACQGRAWLRRWGFAARVSTISLGVGLRIGSKLRYWVEIWAIGFNIMGQCKWTMNLILFIYLFGF